MRVLICITLFGLVACSDGAQTVEPQDHHPFVGCWQSEDGLAREVWHADPSGWLFGYALNRDENGQVSFFEQMRIADGVLTVIGPNTDATSFDLVKSDTEYVFENAEHDYPQRITYYPSPSRLDAEISLLDGSQKVEFKKRACG